MTTNRYFVAVIDTRNLIRLHWCYSQRQVDSFFQLLYGLESGTVNFRSSNFPNSFSGIDGSNVFANGRDVALACGFGFN